MENQFIAKSNPKQTIHKHTQIALEKYEQLKGKYPNLLSQQDWELLKLAVFYHDIGKVDTKFQNPIYSKIGLEKLRDNNPQYTAIPHNFLSCCFINEKEIIEQFGEDGCELLYKSIFYHHDRQFKKEEFIEYVKKCYIHSREKFKMDYFTIPDRLSTKVISYYEFDEYFTDAVQKRYFLLKGLLNRIDYAASAGIDMIEESCGDEDGKCLTQLVQKMFDDKGYKLRPVQQYMLENRDENLVVIAATGSGKTEAALLWIGDCKGFYTLPLKVSINAIYERIKVDVGYGYKNVGLLHSDALSYHLQKQNESDIDAHNEYTCARLLAKPLTICTIDQLFKFVFRYNGGEVSLATLAYSRLIIDEIQMYSKDLVAIILVALKMITELGGKFSILTATFPPILYDLMGKYEILPQGTPSIKIFHSEFGKRHRIKLLIDSDFDYEDILERASRKKILIIANTVSRAQTIYNNLKNTRNISVKLLHSSFIKEHRSLLEKEILEFASNDKKKRTPECGIWVSTQIVEASLDIDFDILYTEMSTIDSLLQRAGRVYRSRMYDLGNEPNIYILDGKNGYGKVIDDEIYDFSLAAVKAYDGQLLEESDAQDLKQEMINMVYHEKNNPDITKSKYYREIKKKIDMLLNLPMYEMDKDDVKEKFRDIDTKIVIPQNIYNQLNQEGKIEIWKKELENKSIIKERQQSIKDDILQHTISLSHYRQDISSFEGVGFLYKKFRIYKYLGEYEFDKINHSGRGLTRNRSQNKSNQAGVAEFL